MHLLHSSDMLSRLVSVASAQPADSLSLSFSFPHHFATALSLLKTSNFLLDALAFVLYQLSINSAVVWYRMCVGHNFLYWFFFCCFIEINSLCFWDFFPLPHSHPPMPFGTVEICRYKSPFPDCFSRLERRVRKSSGKVQDLIKRATGSFKVDQSGSWARLSCTDEVDEPPHTFKAWANTEDATAHPLNCADKLCLLF